MTEAPCRQHQATQETQQDTSSEGLTEQPSRGTCRLCLEEDKISQLVSCCGCTGTCKYIHTRCLRQWQQALWAQGQLSRITRCDLCCQSYQTQQQFDPSADASVWDRLKQHLVQLQSSPEWALRAWRWCILLGGLAAGTHHGVSGFSAGLNLGLRMARPVANWTFRLMPQLSVAAAVLPSLAPTLRSALRCSCSLMLLEVSIAAAAGLFGGGLVGFCLGTVGVVKLSARFGCQAAAVAANVAAGATGAAWPRALALALLKGGRNLQLRP